MQWGGGPAAYNDKRHYGMGAKAIQIIDQLYRKPGFNYQKDIWMLKATKLYLIAMFRKFLPPYENDFNSKLF